MTKRTVSQIIDAFGGQAAFGRLIGKNASTASEMKRRGSIPPKYWRRIVEAEPVEGDAVTYEELALAHDVDDEVAA